MAYFAHILHTNACQHYLLACVAFFLIDVGFLNIISASCGQLVSLLIILEPHGIFGSNFALLFISKYIPRQHSNTDMVYSNVRVVESARLSSGSNLTSDIL